jgi:hypothetical protein
MRRTWPGKTRLGRSNTSPPGWASPRLSAKISGHRAPSPSSRVAILQRVMHPVAGSGPRTTTVTARRSPPTGPRHPPDTSAPAPAAATAGIAAGVAAEAAVTGTGPGTAAEAGQAAGDGAGSMLPVGLTPSSAADSGGSSAHGGPGRSERTEPGSVAGLVKAMLIRRCRADSAARHTAPANAVSIRSARSSTARTRPATSAKPSARAPDSPPQRRAAIITHRADVGPSQVGDTPVIVDRVTGRGGEILDPPQLRAQGGDLPRRGGERRPGRLHLRDHPTRPRDQPVVRGAGLLRRHPRHTPIPATPRPAGSAPPPNRPG